jgi:hypothetical protein
MVDDAMTEAAKMNARDPLDIAERIVRLETKLDYLIANVTNERTSIRELEERIDSMEAWRNRAIGMFMVVNIVFILFLDKIKGFFAHP